MTYFTGTKVGPPQSGKFSLGDCYRDSAGTFWTCTQAGFASRDAVARAGAQFSSVPSLSAGGAITVNAANLTMNEYASGSVRKSVFTLSGVSVTVADATTYGGTKLFTFPEGRILVLGVTAKDLAPTTTSAIASTINSGVAGKVALGTATAANAPLSGTDVDLLPATSITTSTTINVAAASVDAALVASAQFDGTSTAKACWLNNIITTATDIDADGTITWTGEVRVTWVFLGDY